MTTPPSRLVRLAEVPRMMAGDKVRFAGRVVSYNPHACSLTVTQNESSASDTPVTVAVDVMHVLTTAQKALFEPGARVSVIGYIVASRGMDNASDVYVQALVMWDVGRAASAVHSHGDAIRGDGDGEGDEGYENAVAARARAMRVMREARGA